MNPPATDFRILTNGKLRGHYLPGGQGGLFHDWVALTRYTEASPLACGPMLYLREGDDWFLPGDPAHELSVTIEPGIAPGVDVEVRKISVTNVARHPREIELTTYAEIALNHPAGDAGHPAFSKLFVQTSVAGNFPLLLARRRPRGLNENWPWLAQSLSGGDSLSWETNRATFLGRGRTPLDPAAMDRPGELPGETGNVLDPVMAWRTHVALGPEETRTLWLVTAVAADETTAVKIVEKAGEPGAAAEILASSDKAAVARLSELGLDPATTARCDSLAAVLLFGRGDRTVPASLAGSEALRRFPLSGEEFRAIATAGWTAAGTRELVVALPYWQALGLRVCLFVMDPTPSEHPPEGVTFVDPESFTADERAWWLASAQLVAGERPADIATLPLTVARLVPSEAADDLLEDDASLECFNGHGGFSADGDEYVIPLPLESGRLPLPPMPWVNILANPDFGCMVTERGAGYTWSRNSQANRLTAWSNDPIRDPHGEAFYLRDDDSGEVWSPLPGPCPPRSAVVVRHGFGFTRFESSAGSLTQTVEFLVPPEDRVKLVSLRLTNESNQRRNLAFASYQKLVLGSSPDRHHAVLAWTDAEGVQHAVNPRAGDFTGGRVFSFAALHGTPIISDECNHSSATFLGAGGFTAPSLFAVAGVWENDPGFGSDACFSRSLTFALDPGAEVEIVIGLGEIMSVEEENRVVGRYQRARAYREIREETRAHWQDLLGHLRIRTPLKEVDLMVNGWLTYQNLACRIWGRSAFYQSGGAFGFRDQLQDSGALAALHPELMRSQILIHAAQQFPEGDVTHWWHPDPMNRGMRTNFSDDLLWLPYLTDHYLESTGDVGVLEEILPFIEGPLLGPDEDEEYMKPEISDREETVFEHCCLAIDKSLTKGVHGLPLMGIGDWNDGMSRIGREGRGESVWMGFFLFTILNRWIPRCEARGETVRAQVYTNYRDELLEAINDAGWDGEWYRRAYYDDGTPLGTHTDSECRIDALAQAWAVISKAAPPDRIELSLDSLERELVDEKHGLIKLLDPPFVNTPHDPGYIKGYVAGVRENGGQYTHAACWVIRALAEAGRKDEAARYLQHLSPVWHSRDAEAVALYQVEPYVVAADIYGADPHVGRGGWTWYTGSAGWMFRVAVESVLGLRVEGGDTLVLAPRIPNDWPGFSIAFRTPLGKTSYPIEVLVEGGNSGRVTALTVDGVAVKVEDGIARWPMSDDDGIHPVQVTLGA